MFIFYIFIPLRSAFISKDNKVVLRFEAVGSAPALVEKRSKAVLNIDLSFVHVIKYLRKLLQLQPAESLFLYINGAFQPHPEDTVADLFRVFHINDTLTINYCTTAAWCVCPTPFWCLLCYPCRSFSRCLNQIC